MKSELQGKSLTMSIELTLKVVILIRRKTYKYKITQCICSRLWVI